MSRKKSKGPAKKKAKSTVRGKLFLPADDGLGALSMIQNLVAGLSDDERLGLMEAMLGGPVDSILGQGPLDFEPSRRKKSNGSQLIQQALSQPSAKRAVPLLEEAANQARQALGPRFERYRGQLGDIDDGLDYLEAQAELSTAQWVAGDKVAALARAEEAFALDPDDPFEVRVSLLRGLLDVARIDDADRLLREDCPEPWAAWHFGRLLVLLRKLPGERDGAQADRQLKLAYRANPHVLALLLGERIPDATPAGFIETGEDSEAQEFATNFLPAWKDTPGAIRWLREAAQRLKLEVLPDDPDFEPEDSFDQFDAASLPPHQHPTWVVGQYQTKPLKLAGDKRARRRWLLFAFSPKGDEIEFDIRDKKAREMEFWQFLVGAMHHAEPPGRPEQLLVYPKKVPMRLRMFASMAGITIATYDGEEQLQQLLEQLSMRLQGGTAAARSLPAGAIGEIPLDPDEVWEAAAVQVSQRIHVGGQSLRPWIVLVMSRGEGLILWHEMLMESPAPGTLASAVRMAMASPAIGPPRRPRQVVVHDLESALALKELSDEAGFTHEIAAELPAIQDALDNLTKHVLGGEPVVVLGRIEGISAADLERYYTVAAEYFRAQPWKRFGMDEVLALDGAEPPVPRRFALVMGQSGITLGLAVYTRLESIREAFDAASPEDNAESTDGFSVTFGEEEDVAPADLDAVEQFGWPVATPEAYPSVFRVRPGPSIEPPTADELRYLTAALAGITRLATSGDKETAFTAPGVTLKVSRLGAVGEI